MLMVMYITWIQSGERSDALPLLLRYCHTVLSFLFLFWCWHSAQLLQALALSAPGGYAAAQSQNADCFIRVYLQYL